LDTSTAYEWFITHSFHTQQQRGLIHTIRASCVTEDYDVSETFLVDPTTLTCPSLDYWLGKLFPNGVAPGVTPDVVLKKGFHFFARVQIKWPTCSVGQKMYYELNVESLSPSHNIDASASSVQTEVDRIVALGKSRSETLALLEQKGAEYVRVWRKGGST
jgi:hypothetical protein